MTRQGCGRTGVASCCWRSCCSLPGGAARKDDFLPPEQRLPLHHARRRRPRHRRLEHRAGLLPVQEEDGRRLDAGDRAARRAAVAEGRRPHRRILRHAGNLSRQGRSAGAVHDRRCARPRSSRSSCDCRAARMRACAIRRRNGRPKSHCPRPARARQRRTERAARQEIRGRRQRRFPAARRSVPLRRRPAAARLDPAHLGDRRRLLPL